MDYNEEANKININKLLNNIDLEVVFYGLKKPDEPEEDVKRLFHYMEKYDETNIDSNSVNSDVNL